MKDRIYLDTLRRKAGMSPRIGEQRFLDEVYGTHSFEALKHGCWSDDFETLMRNRLIVGGIRHDRLCDPGPSPYDIPEDIQRRIKEYVETGNQELLVDISALAMFEFVKPSHLCPKWEPQDDGEHVKKKGIRK